MEKVERYTIVESPHAKELAGMVNEKLADGWQPYGPLTYGDLLYVQAMVKTAEQAAEKPRLRAA